MLKKVLGILFLAAAVMLLVGSIANGSLFADKGNAIATYVSTGATLFVMLAYVLSGLFVFNFDSATKVNYVDGFKKRSKQCGTVSTFMAIYIALAVIVYMGMLISISTLAMVYESSEIMKVYITTILPYFVPLIIFIMFYSYYNRSHNFSKKYFVNSDAALQQYLSANVTFYNAAADGSVYYSNEALFFPKLLCVIPFNQIESTRLSKVLWEQNVEFKCTNGKKLVITNNNYDAIQQIIANHNANH